jgi:mannose-6-phosphate isomerase
MSGTATCVLDGRTVVARPGETVEVPIGAAHRISNAHDEDLVIIEIQRGAYTGEDDIVRLDDDYGRCESLQA